MDLAVRILFWVAAVAVLAAFLAGSIDPAAEEAGFRPARWLPRVGTKVYAALLGLVLLLFRWPAIIAPAYRGSDEGEWIAGALTLLHDPVFWRSVDGTTGGPLIYYPLLPLEALGWLNHAGLRIVATLLTGGAVWFSYAGFRCVWGDAIARLSVLPAVGFFAFETRLDFVFYSTEHVPLLLLAIAAAGLLCVFAREERFSPWAGPWLAAGCVLGAVPFGKLQAVPPAGALVMTAVAWALTRRAWAVRRRLAAVATMAGAVCVAPAGFAAMIARGVKWEDFWIPYIAQNGARSLRTYGGGTDRVAWMFVRHSPFLEALLAGSLLIVVVAVLAGKRWPKRSRWMVILLLGQAGAAVMVGLVPAYAFHHLLFLALPATLLAGGLMAMQWKESTGDLGRFGPGRRGWLLMFLAGMIVPPLCILIVKGRAWRSEVAWVRTPEIGTLAREILRRAQPEDRVSVWGYSHELHVQTRLIQGTRDTYTALQIRGRYREYFRRRYLEDLERNKPRFFVDQTSMRPGDEMSRSRAAHEAVGEMRDYIARNYDCVGEFEGMRLFVRKDAGR